MMIVHPDDKMLLTPSNPNVDSIDIRIPKAAKHPKNRKGVANCDSLSVFRLQIHHQNTMNQIIQFNNHEIRTTTTEGELWWVANDACEVLDLKNPRMVLTRIHPDDVRSMDVIDGLGRPQKTNFVSESGLYDLIFQSRKPEAAAFRRWVTKEVLPSIRKNGFYSADKTLACRFLELSHALQNANMLPVSAHKLALKLIKISDDSELGDVVRLVETLMSEGGDPDLVKKIKRELPRRIKIAKHAESLRING